MKRIVFVLVLAIIAAGVTFAANDTYIVNVDTLNVRKGAGADYELAGQLTKGTRVEVLNNSGQWWKIKAGNVEGYVNSNYLTPAEDQKSSSSSSSSSKSSSSSGGGSGGFDPLSFPPPLQAGNLMLDAGIGLLPASYLVSLLFFETKWKIIPLFIQAEYALPAGVPISVGGMFSIYQYGIDFYSYEWKYTNFIVAARANWHWGFDIDWLDLYTGLSLGWLFGIFESTWSYYTDDPDSSFYFGFQVGAHFYFTKNIGAILETGYPYWLKAGISFKF
jgi:uncharacterized protein YgiM (DUF1202 family)